MDNIHLDASVLGHTEQEKVHRVSIELNHIAFEFPNGFTQLRLIEECRAMNCLDVSDPDNFDFMFDITMQMLVGKSVEIYYKDFDGSKTLIESFLVTDRYMNLRGVYLIDKYPILVNWLVEFIAASLGKKYPHSLDSIRSVMSAKNDERMKKSQKESKSKK